MTSVRPSPPQVSPAPYAGDTCEDACTLQRCIATSVDDARLCYNSLPLRTNEQAVTLTTLDVRRGGEALVELEIAEEVSWNGQGEEEPPEAVSPLPEEKEGAKGKIIFTQAWRG